MRALRLIPIALLLVLLTVATASAQTVRYANPPIVTVQIASLEPLPPGVPLDVYYGGLGGGSGEFTLIPPGPVWNFTPGALAVGQFAYLAACGYRGAEPPVATLTTPSGAIVAALVEPFPDGTVQCYDFSLPFAYGMELGLYTLTLRHPEGDLTHTFGYDYPFCWAERTTGEIEWITGLTADEQVTLYFYEFAYEPGVRNFVAQRSVRATADGVLAFDLDVARSAPFTQDDLFFIPASIGRMIIEAAPALDTEPFLDLGFSVAARPQPATPPHVSPAASGFNADARGVACDGEHEQFAITHPIQDAAPIPLYASVNGSEVVGSLPMGQLVEILESVPAITDGRVYAWNRVTTQSGLSGWTPSLNLITVFASETVGGRARILTHYQLVNGAHQPIPVPLFSNDGRSRPLPPGTELTLLQELNESWEVRLDDGTTGVIPWFDPLTFAPSLQGLPWPLPGQDFVATPVANGGGSANTSAQFACPNGLPIRLAPGMTARVTPGDPNNIRIEPEAGRVIGQIPAGAQFRVLDGPACGPANGLSWWQVEYNGVIGWTAEGSGGTYWLEPVSVG